MESRTIAQNLRVHQFGNCKPQFAWAEEEPGTSLFVHWDINHCNFPQRLCSHWWATDSVPAIPSSTFQPSRHVAKEKDVLSEQFPGAPLVWISLWTSASSRWIKLWIDWTCWQLSDYFPICSPFLFLIDPEIAVILLKTRFLHFAPPVMSPFAPLWMSTLFRLPRVTVQSDQKRHRNRAVDSTD